MENCPDIRNTRAIDIYHEFRIYGVNVDIFDPWASPVEVNLDSLNFESTHQILPKSFISKEQLMFKTFVLNERNFNG